HDKEERLHLDLEFGPFAPFDPCNAKHADKAGGYRCERVHEAGAQLVSQNRDLTGNADQIGERSHDRHGESRLSGDGCYKQVEETLEDIHEPCSADRGNTFKNSTDSVQDGVQCGCHIRVGSAQYKEDAFRHTYNNCGTGQIGNASLECGSHSVDRHTVKFEDYGDNACNKTHYKELGGDFRNVEAFLGNSPDDPDKDCQHFQKDQLLSKVKFSLFIRNRVHTVAEICVARVYNRFLRSLADAFRVYHHECRGSKRYRNPHNETESCAGKNRNSSDTLGNSHREGAHPGYGVTHLGRNIGDGYCHNGVVAQCYNKGYHDHGKRNTFFSHTEGRAAKREKDEQKGQSQSFQTFCLFDERVDTRVNGACLHNDTESAAHNQDQRADTYCGAGTVSGYKTFKNIIQETESAEVVNSPAFGCLVNLLSGCR